MTLAAEPANLPRLPDQQSEVLPGSPTALVALFTEIVRERFRPTDNPDESLPWVWSESPTPYADETGDILAPRKVLIEPSFSESDEVRNYRPAIVIDKQATRMEKVALNNFAGMQINTGFTGFYAQASVPMDIEVIATKRLESATLADTVWFYILAGREQIRSTFGFNDLTSPVLSPTAPNKIDKTQWSTHIFFEVNFDLRWSTLPISPLLQQIVMRYRASGEANPDAFLLTQYIP